MENFFKEHHKERLKKGIKLKIIFNFDGIKFARERDKLPLTKSRYLPKKIPIPSYLIIVKDTLAIIYMTEKSCLSFVIKNKEIADGHLQFFNLMWKLARKP